MASVPHDAIIAETILHRFGMDGDGEMTLSLKVSFKEVQDSVDLNKLRSWVKTKLKLYLVKEAENPPQVMKDGQLQPAAEIS